MPPIVTDPSPPTRDRSRMWRLWPCLVALWAAPALATPPPTAAEKPRIQFVDMSEMLIDGAAVKPRVLSIETRASVRFGRLFALERPVLHRLKQTARDTSLR